MSKRKPSKNCQHIFEIPVTALIKRLGYDPSDFEDGEIDKICNTLVSFVDWYIIERMAAGLSVGEVDMERVLSGLADR